MLYHNGYVVKDLIENEDLLINHSAYRGVQSYHNWPLAREQDPVSKELTREVDHEFEKNGYVEILGDTELLKKYVAHCKDLKIEVVVMKIMSASDARMADEDLEEREELGYDCMAGDSVSYLVEVLSEDPDTPESYKKIKGRLNANGLLRRYEEVEDFIRERNKLLEQGVNLEDYWEPVPVRLSLVAV